MAAFCAAAVAGRFDEATRLDAELQPLHEAMFVETNPIPVKWALAAMGRIEEGIRLPLVQLSAAAQVKVRDRMTTLGLL